MESEESARDPGEGAPERSAADHPRDGAGGEAGDVCAVCGAPARVQILLGYVRGSPEYRFFCIDCADRHPVPPEPEADRGRPGLGSLLILAGIVIVFLTALAGEVGVTGQPGFGGYQIAGVVGGALLVLLGSLLRVDPLAVVGVLLLALALSADAIGVKGLPGIGWKKLLAGGVALVLVVAGVWLRRRSAARRR